MAHSVLPVAVIGFDYCIVREVASPEPDRTAIIVNYREGPTTVGTVYEPVKACVDD